MNTRPRTPLVLSAALLAALGLAGCQQETDDTVDMAPPVADETPAGTLPPEPTTPPPGTLPEDTTGDMGGDMGEDMDMGDDAAAGTQPTALDVTAIALGTEADAEGGIASPQESFSPEDDIVVAIDTDGAATEAEVRARLVSGDGETVAEQSETVTTTGADTTTLTFSSEEPLAAGDYTVEVWIDGSEADSTELTVE